MNKYEIFLLGILISFKGFSAAEEDLMSLSQTELRSRLQTHYSTIPPSKRENLHADCTGRFLLFNSIEPLGNVLEVGGAIGASLRAFKRASSISIVEPDIDSLAVGLCDEEGHRRSDGEFKNSLDEKGKSGESHREYAKRMNLNMTWVDEMRPGERWIDEEVKIYPCTLQELSSTFDRTFNLIVYKDYNIDCGDEMDTFFKRLSELVTEDGTIILQFWLDEYEKHHNKKGLINFYMNKFFENIKEVRDEKKSWKEEVEEKWIEVQEAVVEFVVLKNSKAFAQEVV